MNFIFDERPSDSPLVERVWHTTSEGTGTFMPHLPTHKRVNQSLDLPTASGHSFWLHGSVWQYPDIENADTFIARLVRDGLLAYDPIVQDTLQNRPPKLSLRSLQRRFLRATGLTYGTIEQIERAHQASRLLERGVSILDTVEQIGYADQPHLTRSLKRFTGQTPGQILLAR